MEELQRMDDLHDELAKKDEELKNARQVSYFGSYSISFLCQSQTTHYIVIDL